MSMSAQLRHQVWLKYNGETYNHMCYCCGDKQITAHDFHVGHVVARAVGGTLDIENLRPICSVCNYSCGTKHLRTFVREQQFVKTRFAQQEDTMSAEMLALRQQQHDARLALGQMRQEMEVILQQQRHEAQLAQQQLQHEIAELQAEVQRNHAWQEDEFATFVENQQLKEDKEELKDEIVDLKEENEELKKDLEAAMVRLRCHDPVEQVSLAHQAMETELAKLREQLAKPLMPDAPVLVGMQIINEGLPTAQFYVGGKRYIPLLKKYFVFCEGFSEEVAQRTLETARKWRVRNQDFMFITEEKITEAERLRIYKGLSTRSKKTITLVDFTFMSAAIAKTKALQGVGK